MKIKYLPWFKQRAKAVAVIDALSGVTAAMMTTVPAFLAGPDIPLQGLPTGEVGQPFSYTVVRTGEHAYNVPFHWTFTGQLPAGLALDAVTGVVSGTPTTPGSATCDIYCIDSYAPQQRASRTGFTFHISE